MDRRFWVASGRRADFVEVFGPGGNWERLLRRAEGYRMTVVQEEALNGERFRVKDYWMDHRDFEVFRGAFHEEYEWFAKTLDAEGIIERIDFLGNYYQLPDDGDEQNLVLS